jgi:hypothetical protein
MICRCVASGPYCKMPSNERGTRDWLISSTWQFMTGTLEPNEVFPHKLPNVTIKQKYRHIFALDKPLVLTKEYRRLYAGAC